MLHDLSKPDEADNAFAFITAEAARGNTVEIKIVKPHNQRTLRQNAALHLAFSQIADELTSSGLDIQHTLTKPLAMPWTETLVKELIFRPVMKAKTGKDSTTKLTTAEVDEVFNLISKYFGETHGLSIEFPSINSLINKGR